MISNNSLLNCLLICFLILSPITSSVCAQEASGFKAEKINTFPQSVMGMTIDEHGILYFADTYENLDDVSRIYMLNPPYNGEPIPTEIEGHSITGLMWHDDKLYVAFLNDDEIIIYDNQLEFLESRPISSPLGFTTDGTTIYVLSYYGEIGVITNNRVRIFLDNIQSPTDIRFSGKNSMYIAHKKLSSEKAKITEIGIEGEMLATIVENVEEPSNLELDLDGNLLFTDKAAGKVYLQKQGESPQVICDTFDSPIGIVRIPSGGFLVNANHEGGVLFRLHK